MLNLKNKEMSLSSFFFFFAQPVHMGCVNRLCEALIDLILVIFFLISFFLINLFILVGG